jgi:hypothetical protein
MLGLGQKIGRVTWRGIVGDTRQWKYTHREQVLAMVDPERLKRAEEYAFENGCDIFDALDDIRQEEPRHRYVHPPSLSPNEIAAGYRRHIPIESKITGSRRKSSVDHEAKTSA